MANDYTQQVQEEDHFLLAVFEGYCERRNTEQQVLREEQRYIEEQARTEAWLGAMLND